MPLQIVLDTNILIAALRSRRGASYRLLSLVGKTSRFQINLSVPLVVEYEEVASRSEMTPYISPHEVAIVIDYLCLVANHHRIFYLWRPYLKDPEDDMILELAAEARCDFIVTFNVKDFLGVERFGVIAITPQVFLQKIGVGAGI